MTDHPPGPPPPRPQRGSVRPAERVLAPDLARGLMLLLIVLSNTGFHLYAAQHGPTGWHPVDGTALDRAVQFAMITALDLRTYPLFAFLFGYGMMQLFRRQTAAGTSERGAAALLRRRGMWLIVFGFAHAALLMAGDILGAYGIASLVIGTLFLRRTDRTLLIAAGGAFAFLVLISALGSYGTVPGDPDGSGVIPSTVHYASGEPDALAAVGTRLATWLFVALGGGLLGFSFHTVMLLGFWAARNRVLEEPERHLKLLRATAVTGVAVGWAGGLPQALAHVGVLDVPAAMVVEEGPFYALQTVTGVFGGLGYVAVVALACRAMPPRIRSGTAVTAVAAVGKRSLSCYLAHSLVFAPVLAAWGLGLGAAMGSATMALFASGVWLLTVAGALLLERKGRRGPAEALLRRLVYGRAERPREPAPAPAASQP
ncbi:DUF418 domain-containing protein [Nocardiopsis sediminis]|uniref:DUF418 domain-containing protein n=1 Tax=Nocardiopsis sediminis TaxID=1778267 RepID=A0ABV8FQ68_9ACTN